MMDWKKIFPQFESELIGLIEKNAVERVFNAGDVIMRTGQYIKSTVLVLEGTSRYTVKTMKEVNS